MYPVKLMELDMSHGMNGEYKVVNQRGGRKKVMYDFKKIIKKINVLICV